MTKLCDVVPSGSSPVHQGGSSVVAMRRTPSSSDIANWFSTVPRTWPLPAYAVDVGDDVSKRCTTVSTGGGGASLLYHDGSSCRAVATYSAVGEA